MLSFFFCMHHVLHFRGEGRNANTPHHAIRSFISIKKSFLLFCLVRLFILFYLVKNFPVFVKCLSNLFAPNLPQPLPLKNNSLLLSPTHIKYDKNVDSVKIVFAHIIHVIGEYYFILIDWCNKCRFHEWHYLVHQTGNLGHLMLSWRYIHVCL